MNNISKLKIFTLMLASGFLISCQKEGCTDVNASNFNPDAKKDDGTCITTISNAYTLSSNITSDKTLTADHIWTLNGRVAVVAGVTLTIEPGTIIKAVAGTGSNASALVIARGAKLIANGTANSPIIMTSISDDIQIGQTQGTSLNINVRGLWGGLLILGNAPGSFAGDVSEFQIEGIPASDINGLYGGNDPLDNSGSIQYLSIRHGGAEIGEGNEINGLTLGCVGAGTIINNIEVIANVDDGIEFFGGSVNASELLVWGQGDDGLDIDQGYSGNINNAFIILNEASDHALEIDGPEGSLTGLFNITNTTIKGAYDDCDATGVDGEMADFRNGATGNTNNILSIYFASGKDVELDSQKDANSYINGTLTFSNWEIVWINNCIGDSIENIFVDKTEISSFKNDASNFATITENPSVGVETSLFNWTYASFNNAF